MHSLQSQLGMTFPPLGQNSSLGITNSFFVQKKSNLLNLSSFIKPLAILKPLLTPSHFLTKGANNGHLRSWDNLNIALKTDLSSESANFQFENLGNNLENYENANENNENFIENPKNLKKSLKKTSNRDNSSKNVDSSELATGKNAKSKKQTKPQSKANSLAKFKKATKENSVKNVETAAMRHLNTSQDIAANSPTVIPTPQTFTPVEESNVAHNVALQAQSQPSILDLFHSTIQTQTTLPSQPNVDLTTTEKTPQIPPLAPTIITPDTDHNSELTPMPGVSKNTPTMGNESTLMRHLNTSQDIAANSPTVIPTPQTFTPVEESNVAHNVTLQAQSQPGILDLFHSTIQTQTTLPSQPNVDLTTTEKPLQLPPLTPTIIIPDTYHNSEPTPISGVSKTTPTLGNESTLMRQSLNTSNKTSPPILQLLYPLHKHSLPLKNQMSITMSRYKPQSQPSILDLSHSTTQTQTQITLPSQPNVDLTTTEKPLQLPPLTPTIITPDTYHNSEPTPISGVSKTTPTLGQ